MGLGGSSQSATHNSETSSSRTNVQAGNSVGEAGSQVSNQGSGSVTINQQSPEAISALQSVSSQAIQTVAASSQSEAQAQQQTTSTVAGLLKSQTSNTTQDLTPIIIGVAVVMGIVLILISRSE
ncbi:MAG: hypothetical protein KGJ13_08730 [Patescibacteria group bacterium]|nr:hypothetical protein [Patescibacteria group bacterium]